MQNIFYIYILQYISTRFTRNTTNISTRGLFFFEWYVRLDYLSVQVRDGCTHVFAYRYLHFQTPLRIPRKVFLYRNTTGWFPIAFQVSGLSERDFVFSVAGIKIGPRSEATQHSNNCSMVNQYITDIKKKNNYAPINYNYTNYK